MGLKLFCLLILGIFACSKVNQWKQPTKVCFEVDVVNETTLDGKLIFDSGYMAIESFVFSGKREEGADVYFAKKYQNVLNAILGNEKIKELEFDIPQGVYTAIKMELTTQETNLPSLVVNGVYKSVSGDEIPLRFEFNESDRFVIEGENPLPNNSNIDLVENAKTNATILLNATKWFELVQPDNLEKAIKVFIDGQNTILINKQTNANVYNSIVIGLNKKEQKAIFVRQV